MPDAVVIVAMYFYFLYMKKIVKSDQIMKFFKMFTTWFGPELILKKSIFPPKMGILQYIYGLIKSNFL